jgi:DNA-binding CsgD family transcriptional regulator
MQCIAILSMGYMSMMDSYDTVYGPGMVLAAWLLMRQYGYFDNYRKIKYFLYLLFVILIAQISAFDNEREMVGAGLAMLEYSIFIITFIVIIWRDMVLNQESLKNENKSLKINYTKIQDKLIELEEEQKPYDLKEARVTPAEERVIKTLTIYKASNREIAERLNIAESTVKLHLYNIFNKIGVDNRFAIIDLCKYNYT